MQSTGHHPSTRDQVSDPFSVALSLMIGVKLMHIDSSVGGVVVADIVCSLRRRLTIVLTKESQIWILFSTWDFCSILRYVWWSSNGRTGWGRLHLHTEDVGSFGSWGYVILICIDVWHLWIPFQRGTHHWRNLVGFVATRCSSLLNISTTIQLVGFQSRVKSWTHRVETRCSLGCSLGSVGVLPSEYYLTPKK